MKVSAQWAEEAQVSFAPFGEEAQFLTNELINRDTVAQCSQLCWRVAFGHDLFFCGVDNIFCPDTDAVFHVENSTVYRDSVQQRCGEMFVFEKTVPFFEA